LTSIVTRGATDVQAAERRRQEEQRRVQDLAQRHGEWLDAARPLLGRADGPYPFEDEAETQRQLRELEEHEAMLQALSKKVNRSAQSMLEQWTDEHKKLVEQRAALLEDKLAIVGSIREVEDRKWSALDDMVRRVSGHFSDLFRICLPYATCRLHEVRDGDTGRLVGLEVKVAFNGQEKESLTELSGGQRSLLALCLILAILRVHPAPVYILDEVDAALDPSHTQNLGRMLKEKFADAQFLLVSLKDGMWSNANVVFEVRNTHGYSEINRIAKR
jgi:structural maintenance of chromosome 2